MRSEGFYKVTLDGENQRLKKCTELNNNKNMDHLKALRGEIAARPPHTVYIVHYENKTDHITQMHLTPPLKILGICIMGRNYYRNEMPIISIDLVTKITAIDWNSQIHDEEKHVIYKSPEK